MRSSVTWLIIIICLACLLPNSAFSAEEKAREGHFIAYDHGVVHDTNTGLDWIAGPDKDTGFEEAKAWVESLKIDGSVCRMPTSKELKSLYERDAWPMNMTSLLKANEEPVGWWVWSGETRGTEQARVFDFYRKRPYWNQIAVKPDFGRGFAVCEHK